MRIIGGDLMRVSFKYDLGDRVFICYEDEIVSAEVIQQIRCLAQGNVNIYYAVKHGNHHTQHHESLISRSAAGLGMRLAKTAKVKP